MAPFQPRRTRSLARPAVFLIPFRFPVQFRTVAPPAPRLSTSGRAVGPRPVIRPVSGDISSVCAKLVKGVSQGLHRGAGFPANVRPGFGDSIRRTLGARSGSFEWGGDRKVLGGIAGAVRGCEYAALPGPDPAGRCAD